jgi:hypothetical protein
MFIFQNLKAGFILLNGYTLLQRGKLATNIINSLKTNKIRLGIKLSSLEFRLM